MIRRNVAHYAAFPTRWVVVSIIFVAVLLIPAARADVNDALIATWGDNRYGQLGNGDSGMGKFSSVPVAVATTAGVLKDKTVSAVSAGGLHTCAVADGQAYCWGWNALGQLGNGDSGMDKFSSVPVAVDRAGVLASKTVTAISAGTEHTCAVADGQAYCWGFNADGQLGNGVTMDSSVPVAVDTAGVLASKTVTAISAGFGHTCAVADGQAYCWGRNEFGQLGNGVTMDSSVPVAVDSAGVLGSKTVTAMSSGTFHTCAVATAQAYCWGSNMAGGLGDNSMINKLVPVAVSTADVLNGKTVTAISAGGDYTCAIADGLAYCWGEGRQGQLGDNSTINKLVPVAVSTAGVLNGKTITAMSAGWAHTCAVADDEAYCWGFNFAGQLGDNSTTRKTVPVAVDTAGFLRDKAVTGISAGNSNSLEGHTVVQIAPEPPSTPAAPTSTSVGNGSVSLAWVAPATRGSAITGYNVQVATSAAGTYTDAIGCTSLGVVLSCTATGLTNGTNYFFKVLARSDAGNSAYSPASSAFTPVSPQNGGGGGSPDPGTPAPGPQPGDGPPESATPTPAPTAPAGTSSLGPVVPGSIPYIPADGLPVGASVLLLNGQPTRVTVKPDRPLANNSTGIEIQGPGFSMNLAGQASNGTPLGVTQSGGLILQADRTASAEGAGFKPDSPIAFYLFSSDWLLGSITTDATGAFRGSVPLPADVSPGRHTMQINGLTPDGAVRSLSLGVQVRDAKNQDLRTIKTTVFFRDGSAVLTPKARKSLRALANTRARAATRTLVVGYRPTTRNSTALSRQRARAVAEYLKRVGVQGVIIARGNGVAKQSGAASRKVTVSLTYRA